MILSLVHTLYDVRYLLLKSKVQYNTYITIYFYTGVKVQPITAL